MDSIDIKSNIIYQLINNTKELINMCLVDKLSRDICSSLSFWKPIFLQHDYHLPKIIPTTHTIWISSFERERVLKDMIDKVMKILEDPQEENFEMLTQEVIDEEPDLSLIFYHGDVSFLKVFEDIEGIDRNKLFLIDNNYIIRKFNNTLDDLAFAQISLVDNDYQLIITDTSYKIKINISREIAEQIFYRILSNGVVLQDSLNGDLIRLIK